MASFSKIGTSARSVLGTRTNAAIHADKECGDEGSELDARHARQDCVQALRKLLQDFETKLQSDMEASSSKFQ